MENKKKLSVVGIGYVGLPLTISLSKFYNLVAFDLDKKIIESLKKNKDITGEFKPGEIKKNKLINFTNSENLEETDIFYYSSYTNN